ncbi:unnamed protein product [Caenorhabditis sp. 36 PRJEB53466]|nr:unnamed protein product [Caenorhabditis sp. 36 PRJEB53466]
MNDPSKNVSEEELEKQYEDYRAQFELWKETNKGSIGTDAYNSYVSQFEQWEQEVETRKKQQKTQRKGVPQLLNEKEAEAVAAYALSQEAYVSHHVKAMEQAEHQQRVAAAAARQLFAKKMAVRQTGDNPATSELFMRGMVNGSGSGAIPAAGLTHAAAQNFTAPPTLWGTPKPVYGTRDPLYSRWGGRAATSHFKPDHEQPVNPVACWLLLDTLRDKKMVLAPHSSNLPPLSATNT